MADLKYYDIIQRPIITEKSMGLMNVEVLRTKKEKVKEDGIEVLKAMKDTKGKFVKEAASIRKYSFYVHKDATKIQIKEAIEKMFDGVKVKKVNTMNVKGKEKRVGRYLGRTPDRKKAIVTLTEDSKDIELFAAN